MKKVMALLLAFVLCLGLCACGGGEDTQMKADAEKYNEYKDLIDKIEAGDFAGAYSDFMGRFPGQEGNTTDSTESSSPDSVPDSAVVGFLGGSDSYTAVEITMDNWQEYFEIVYSEKWETNGFGEAESLIFRQSFRVKDAYKDKLATGPMSENYGISQIAVEFGYNTTYYSISVDFANQTYVKGGIHGENAYSGGAKTDIETIPISPFQTGWEFVRSEVYPYYDNPSMAVWDSIEVLRIQGTLYLADE